MALDVDLPPNEHEELIKARDAALTALHGYADELERQLPKMVAFTPMGVNELQLLSQARFVFCR
jgi:hypothetical protein